jgi:hypothetical protein
MATFLWTLEWGGVTIALVGLSRERWLANSATPRFIAM